MCELSLANVKKGLSSPILSLKYSRTLIRGHIYKIWCKLTGKRVTIGKNFHLDGRITIKGPGMVRIGNNVRIAGHVTPWTHTEEALIEIGNTVFLDGTRFGCVDHIQIGDGSMLADVIIIDTNFHDERPSFRSSPDKNSKPVIVGKKVWITAHTVILKGSEIGDNTIVGPNSVVAGAKLLPNKIYMGNPVRAVKYISE